MILTILIFGIGIGIFVWLKAEEFDSGWDF
jgi:hypothetical protein